MLQRHYITDSSDSTIKWDMVPSLTDATRCVSVPAEARCSPERSDISQAHIGKGCLDGSDKGVEDRNGRMELLLEQNEQARTGTFLALRLHGPAVSSVIGRGAAGIPVQRQAEQPALIVEQRGWEGELLRAKRGEVFAESVHFNLRGAQLPDGRSRTPGRSSCPAARLPSQSVSARAGPSGRGVPRGSAAPLIVARRGGWAPFRIQPGSHEHPCNVPLAVTRRCRNAAATFRAFDSQLIPNAFSAAARGSE